MGAYTYMNEVWKKKQSEVLRFLQRVRCWEYRHQNRIIRVNRPTRPEKARRMGYKRKTGYVVYRIRVRRGGRKRPVAAGICYGKPKTAGVNQLKNKKNTQSIAEEKVGRAFGNIRVLNSYWLNCDGTFKWYEVVCVDPSCPTIRRDPRINWVCNAVHKRREARGLTAAGKKHRGLRHKGHKAPHFRPSARAVWKRHNVVRFLRYR
eukprot:TRINITY_DN2635_c0_g1_i10.p3 TRINITY_DN2635_c0_g1~~TRINITY_DN2635_c0_g1_i10.p3  ORF type:complete len:205 (+),score=93.70 TRINITY_DN2635_c0_g1_i10:87-701(+)